MLTPGVAGTAMAQDPIKIGVDTPLSGTYAGIGQQVRWGYELATKEINAKGGIMGRQIELMFEDTEAKPAVAVQKAEKLFEVDKVDFLIGTVNSGATLAVGQVAERAKKLMATTVSFADAITGAKCSPNVFRVNAKAGQQSAALAAWLAKDEAEGKGVLSRSGLSDGPLDRRGVQGARRAGRRRQPGRGLCPARRQGLLAVFRTESGPRIRRCSIPRWPATTPCACSRRCRNLACLWICRPRRLRHRHGAEHQGHRQGRGRLYHWRRLFGRDRHAGEQDFRRRPSRPPTRPIPISTAPTPMA